MGKVYKSTSKKYDKISCLMSFLTLKRAKIIGFLGLIDDKTSFIVKDSRKGGKCLKSVDKRKGFDIIQIYPKYSKQTELFSVI